jgi:hypothetical protein
MEIFVQNFRPLQSSKRGEGRLNLEIVLVTVNIFVGIFRLEVFHAMLSGGEIRGGGVKSGRFLKRKKVSLEVIH